MTAGRGRPLIITTLDNAAAMRLLAGADRPRVVGATVCSGSGGRAGAARPAAVTCLVAPAAHWARGAGFSRPKATTLACDAVLYTVDGSEYGWFPNWLKHQKVYKPYPSTLPPPPGWAGNQS